MKTKKIIALALTCAMAATATAALAACNDDTNKPGPSGSFVEDTRIWYAVGTSAKKGDLKASNWDPLVVDQKLTFTRDTSITDKNIFTAEFSIYAGDGFKFLYKTSADETIADVNSDLWPRQIGIHSFETVVGEGKDAVLKVGEDVAFTTNDGMDENNLYCAKGQDGVYKFTLETFPEDTSKDPVLNFEKVSSIQVTHDMYLYGDINNYGGGALADAYPLTENISETTTTWTTVLEVKKSDLKRDEAGNRLKTDMSGNIIGDAEAKYAAVQIYNKVEKDGKHETFVMADGDYKLNPEPDKETLNPTAYPTGTAKSFNLLPEGKYLITYDQTTNAVSISEKTHEIYFIGGFNNWTKSDPDYKLAESSDGVWTGYLTVAEPVEMKLYNGLDANDSTAYISNDGGNISLTAGTWAFKYTVDGNKVEYEKCEYYAVGTFVDGEENVNFAVKKDFSPILVATETDGVYSCEVAITDVSKVDGYTWIPDNGVFAIKAVFGSELLGARDWYNPVDEQNTGNNIVIKEVGTYTLTLTISADGGACSVVKK